MGELRERVLLQQQNEYYIMMSFIFCTKCTLPRLGVLYRAGDLSVKESNGERKTW